MSAPNADAWELVGFPGRLDVAAYLTAEQLAAQYRVDARREENEAYQDARLRVTTAEKAVELIDRTRKR